MRPETRPDLQSAASCDRGRRVGTISEDRRGPDTGGSAPRADACLALLFAPQSRPDAAAIARALKDARVGIVSHEPEGRDRANSTVDWIEILASGLTFDAIGIAPGQPLALGAPSTWRGPSQPSAGESEALGIAPGPHLAGAGHLLPVVKAHFGIAAALLSHCQGARGAVWLPSDLGVAAKTFVALVTDWLDGGPFPAPTLIHCKETAARGMVTSGMAFFIGHEIRLHPSLVPDPVGARRLLFRLADRFVENGGVDDGEVVELEDGSRLRITLRGDEIAVDRG